MANEQVRKLIHKLVLEEVRRVLPGVVKEVMAGIIMESTVSEAAFTGNSNKRRALMEASGNPSEFDEYPTMRPQFDRSAMAAKMGYGDFNNMRGEAMAPDGREMIVSSGVTEHGTAVPVNPAELPDHVVNALTRNYSDVMAALNRRKANG